MAEWRLLFYISTVFTLLDQSQSFLYNSCECGEVSPRNVFVSIGASMELTCTIEEDSNHYHLMFTLNNEEQSSEQKGNNSIVLTKVIQGWEDGGNYICMKNGQKVGSATVEVEYPLQNISGSDFVCELLDWDKTLYCRWKIEVYKNKSSNVKVSIVAETMNHKALQPAQQNQTSALWNGPLSDTYSFKFHLTQNQTKTNEVIQQTILRKTTDIVKPAPVSQIFVENISSTCLTVRWENSNPHKFQVYIFFLSDEWNSQNFSNQINKIDSVKKQQWEICDLIPFTLYTFTIIRRPLTIYSFDKYSQSGLWSNPASNTFRTLSDVPASPPKITLGSFSRVDDTRIVLYWKPIKPMDRHGIIANYTISYASLDGNFTGSYSSIYENISLSMNSVKWYNVSLSALTTDGNESPSVFILVPPKTVELTVPSSVVEVNAERTKALVHWEGNASCLYYVIFWMTNNELNWNTSQTNETVIPLANMEKVSVSCSTEVSGPEGQTVVVGGGLQWSKCKYFEGKEPALPASSTVTPYNTALEVTWSLHCNDPSSYPLWLNVTWCDLNPSSEVCQDVFFALVDPSKRFYRIENLNPKIKYRVRINSVSNDSVRINMDFHDQQPQVYENIADNSSKSRILVAFVIASICGVIILVIIFIIRKFRSDKSMEVEVPSIGNKDNRSWSRSVEKYPESFSKEDFKIVDTTEIIDGIENERNYYNVIYCGEERVDKCSGASDSVDVPNILKEMQRMDSEKKEKLKPQLSSYSKCIIASGQTSNSDLNQLHSFPESLVIGSQSPFSWSSNGNNQSARTGSASNQPKSQSGVTNHNLSSPNQSETFSSGTGSGTQNKSATLFSSSSSEVNDDYHEIDHFEDSSTEMSAAYIHSQLNECSGYDTSYQGESSNARMNVNEDSSAATDDELLVESSDNGQGRGMKENTGTSPLQQTVSHLERPPPLNMQIINSALASAISLPARQLRNSAEDRHLVHEAGSEHFSFGASLTSSTSDSIETGYKTVDLDSACLSSVQSSFYD